MNPSASELLTSLAWARQMLGNDAAAARLIERNLAISPEDPYSYYYKALIETRRGDNEAALDSLERAVDLGYPPVMLAAEPFLASLRNEPGFEALVDQDR